MLSHRDRGRRLRRRALRLAATHPLPDGRSHWDRLPAELHDAVLIRAGPLTRLVCGRISNVDRLSLADKERIWLEAVSSNWNGSLRRLPVAKVSDQVFASISTRAMHDRLKVAGLDSPIMWITASNRGWVEAHSAVFDAPWSDSAYSDARMSVNMVLSGKSPIEQMPHFHLGLTAFQGKLDLIKSLRQLSPTYHWPPSVMDAAARSKCIELVRFLHEAGCECSPCALNGASLDGDLDMVRFLVEHGTNARPSQAIDLAASRGHLHVVDYLHTATGESGTFDGLLHAVQAGKAQMADCMLRSFFDPSWDLKLAEDIALSGGDEAVCDVLEAFADERGVATEDDDDGVDFERDAGAS